MKKGQGLLLEVFGIEGSFEAVKPFTGSPSLPGNYSWVRCPTGTRITVINFDHSSGVEGVLLGTISVAISLFLQGGT